MSKVIADHTIIKVATPARASWQNAVGLFQRSVVEAGSPLELEHSQRLGLLYAKNVGTSSDVQKWASLLNAEDIPTCSMMLKALVYHGEWRTAMQLFEWSSDTRAFPQLAEHLAQFLLTQNFEQEAFSVVARLLECGSKPRVESASQSHEASSVSAAGAQLPSEMSTRATEMELPENVMNDIIGLSQNPAYLPPEEVATYCGLGSVVLRMFPKNSQWAEAVSTLRNLRKMSSGETQVRLMEYEQARQVYGGRQYERAKSEISSYLMAENSANLQRILLHALLELGDVDGALATVEKLSHGGQRGVPTSKLEHFVRMFISHYDTNSSLPSHIERRFVRVVVQNYSSLYSAGVRVKLAVFLSQHNVDATLFCSTALDQSTTGTATEVSQDEAVVSAMNLTQPNDHGSISALDRRASALLQQGNWREALAVLEKINNAEPQNDRERVILETIRDSHGDWEKTLLFFS